MIPKQPSTLSLCVENEKVTACLAGIHSREYTNVLKNVKDILHPEELDYFSGLKYERRKLSYLLGRYAAKVAASDYLNDKKLTKIEIFSGLFNQPVVRHLSFDTPDVTISHCDDIAVAIAFSPCKIMGLDIEYIAEEKLSVFETQLTESEKHMTSKEFDTVAAGAVCIWTIKEALSKAIKCGFTVPFKILELKKITPVNDSAYLSEFKNFKQYKSISVIFYPYILSIVLPCKMMVNTTTSSMLSYFNQLVY
ncbi:phosphopantetheinyl transferase [Candidatus Scalindua japonica]|uniref:Phosphopantetheinyl transferase n=1 Tax=Candidatus Scalindua japonica TaxID=1284222 RepID=A0A286TT87_9BACT|nr:4'-phosphopantetheinyl transferase superfamily protein [Candidatus Scalindua japonica]GAX59129.1 phosphopantetheinyl transferase [Candidatus Scalindua japonica]